jgi:hypothetical protein
MQSLGLRKGSSAMAKSKTKDDQPEDEAVIMVRMNEALKRMMSTPHETHKAMVRRRRDERKPERAARKKGGLG